MAASVTGPLGAVPASAGFFDFLNDGKTGSGLAPRPRASVPSADDAAPASARQEPQRTGFFGFLRQPATPHTEPGDEQITGSIGPVEVKPTKEMIDYATAEYPGTVIINTGERALYLVMERGKALKYGIGVGREGFEWSGTEFVTRKQEWPDWRPPAEMRERQPYLPSFFAGGPENPMGARAIYLGSSLYRIHGTIEDWTIGKAVSSGCIRMLNDDIEDLYTRVPVGAKVVVL